jgi:hypothetical protein
MRRILPWFGLTGFLFCIAIAIYASVDAALHPFNSSEWDGTWALFYLVLIAGGGILFLTHRYRALLQITFWSTALLLVVVLVFSGNGPALFGLLWLLAIAMALGEELLDRLSLHVDEHPFERLLIATGLGLGILSIFILVLGSAHFLEQVIPQYSRYLHLLHPIPVFAGLILVSLRLFPGLIWRLRPHFAQTFSAIRQTYRTGDLRAASAWVGCIFICGLGIFIWSLSPGIWFDSLIYHLSAPSLYILNHGIIQITEPLQFLWAHDGEMLLTLAMIVAGQPLTGLLPFGMGLLTLGMVYCFGQRIGGSRTGLLASMVFFSLPILFVSGIAYNDIMVTFFGFAMLFCLLLWWQEQKPAWLLVSGVMGGFAMGTKYNAAVVIVPAALLLVIGLVRCYRLSGPTWRGILAFGIPILLLFAPWALINYLWVGNPFFPFLGEFFHSSGSTAGAFSASNYGNRFLNDFLLLPWNLTVNGGKYFIETSGGITSGILLIALPWLSLSSRSRPALRRMALLLVLFFVAVIFIDIPFATRVRYLLPAFPVFCVLAALNLEAAWEGFFSRLRPSLGFAVVAILFLVYLFTTRMVFTSYGWQVAERYPFKVALGLETQAQYLSKTLSGYDALQYLNQVGNGRHLVASFGEETRSYTSSTISSVFFSNTIPGIMSQAKTGEQLAQTLGSAGFDYLLMDRANIRKFPTRYDFPVIDSAFLQKYTRLEYASNNTYVYHIYPQGAPAEESTPVILVPNDSFEETGASGAPFNWDTTGNPVIDRSGAKAHSGQTAVSVTSGDLLYMTVPAETGKLYTLKEWIRSDAPAQTARLQIMWIDQNNGFGGVSIDTIPVSTEWKQYDLSVNVPPGMMAARVYISAHDNSQVWVDDVCLAQGETCQP